MADAAVDEVTNGEAGEAAPSPAKEKRMPVRRLPRPDQSLVKAQIEKLKDEISQNQQRQDKIREELEKRRSGRTTSTDQQTIKNRLMELRSQFQALLVCHLQIPSPTRTSQCHQCMPCTRETALPPPRDMLCRCTCTRPGLAMREYQ